MPLISMISSSASSGRFTANKPTLTYLSTGAFTITNYNSSFTYTASNGTVSSAGVLTIPTATGSCTLTARSSKGLAASTLTTISRQAAVQSSYRVQTAPTQCYGPSGCGACGGGTYYNANVWCGGCPAGFYCCCDQGYTVYYYVNYGPTYTWSSSNYTNGSGEWYNIT